MPMKNGYLLMTQVPKARAVREQSFGFLVQSIARGVDAKLKAELSEVGIDVKIFANLMLLWEEDGISQRALAQKLNNPEYFTSRNIDALVAAGFAVRESDPTSRRTYLIHLTDAGRAKAKLLPKIIKRVNDEALADLDAAEKAQLVPLLQKVAGVGPFRKP